MHLLPITLLAATEAPGPPAPTRASTARSSADHRAAARGLRVHDLLRAPAPGHVRAERRRRGPAGRGRRGLGGGDGRGDRGPPAPGAVRRARPGRQAVDLDPGRRAVRGPRVPRGQPDRRAAGGGHHDRDARAPVLGRVHGPRPGHVAVLRLPQPVHGLDARARPSEQLGARVRGLGAGRAVVLLADRVLVPEESAAWRQEGVHRQSRRRTWLRAGHHGHLGQHGHPRHRGFAGTADRDAGQSSSPSRSRSSPCSCSRARWARAPVPASSLARDAMEGPTPVSAPSTRPPWSTRACTWWPGPPAVRARAGRHGRGGGDRHIHRHPGRPRSQFTQTDIKRVLAYSTLSSLGYMFAAMGTGPSWPRSSIS